MTRLSSPRNAGSLGIAVEVRHTTDEMEQPGDPPGLIELTGKPKRFLQ